MPHFFRTICQAGLIFTAAFFAATSVAHPPTPPWEECACEDEQFTITLNTTHPDDQIHLLPEKDFYRRGEAVVVISTPGPGRSFKEWDTPHSSQSAYGLTGSVNQVEHLYVDGNITIDAKTVADRTLSLGYTNGHVDVLSGQEYTGNGGSLIVTVPHGDTVVLTPVLNRVFET